MRFSEERVSLQYVQLIIRWKAKKLKIRFVKLRSLVHCAVILLISSQMMGKEMGVQTTSQGPQVDEIYAAWSEAASRSMVNLRVLSSVYTQKDVNRGSNWMGKPRVTSYKESTIWCLACRDENMQWGYRFISLFKLFLT